MQMPPIPNKVIAPAIGFVVAVLILVTGSIGGMWGILILPCVLIVMLLTSKPRALLTFYCIMILFLPTIEILFDSVYLKIAEQGFGLALLAVLLASGTIEKAPVAGTKWIIRTAVALSIIIIISAVVNKVPAKCMLFFFLIYMKHFWIFLFALRFLKKDDSKYVFVAIVAAILIQLPFNIATYCGINPLPFILARGFVDLSIGTLGNASDVGYFMIAGIILLCSYIKYASTGTSVLVALVAVLLFCVQFFLTYTIHAYPLLIMGVVMQFGLFAHKSMSKGIRLLFTLGVASVVLIVLMLVGPYKNMSTQLTSKARIIYRWEKTSSGPKIEAYKAVFLHGSSYLPYPALGGGPANYSSSIARLLDRPLAHLPHMGYVHETFYRDRVSMGGSILSLPQTGFIALWGELGPLGFLMYWMANAYAVIRIFRQTKRELYTRRYKLILAEAFVPCMIIGSALNVLTDIVPLSHFNLMLWIWAAAVWLPDINKLEDSEKENDANQQIKRTEPAT